VTHRLEDRGPERSKRAARRLLRRFSKEPEKPMDLRNVWSGIREPNTGDVTMPSCKQVPKVVEALADSLQDRARILFVSSGERAESTELERNATVLVDDGGVIARSLGVQRRDGLASRRAGSNCVECRCRKAGIRDFAATLRDDELGGCR
jgi:hypothetical protein